MLKQPASGHSRRGAVRSFDRETEIKRVQISGPSLWQRPSGHDVNADGDRGDRNPICGRRPLAKDWNGHDGSYCRGQSGEGGTARGTKNIDRTPVENERNYGRQDPLHQRLKSYIAPWGVGETRYPREQIGGNVENQSTYGGDACRVQPIEPRATHRNRVAGPSQARAEK